MDELFTQPDLGLDDLAVIEEIHASARRNRGKLVDPYPALASEIETANARLRRTTGGV